MSPTSYRTPTDGRPFYCVLCGAGRHDWTLCERDCQLEAPEIAAARKVETHA